MKFFWPQQACWVEGGGWVPALEGERSCVILLPSGWRGAYTYTVPLLSTSAQGLIIVEDEGKMNTFL